MECKNGIEEQLMIQIGIFVECVERALAIFFYTNRELWFLKGNALSSMALASGAAPLLLIPTFCAFSVVNAKKIAMQSKHNFPICQVLVVDNQVIEYFVEVA